MAEYIEREALLRAVTHRKVIEMLRSDITEQMIDGRNPSAWLNGFDCGMQQAINIIAAADVVEVRHGVWVDYADRFWKRIGRMDLRCSLCGDRASNFVGGTEDWWDNCKPNYCPNCGAKMDGKGEE